MLRIINVIAITLLIALVSVIPASLLGPLVPSVFDLGLQRIAVAAWIAGIISWFVAQSVVKGEADATQKAKKGSSGGAAVMTLAFLAVAIGVAVFLHFFGDELMW